MTKATLRQSQYQEWLESLELVPPAAGSEGTHDKSSLRDLICDGVVLCHLVNKIKPGSVETIKTKRSSGNAEENVLRFLQACTTLGVKKIFRPVDLLHENKDFSSVLITLQFLYNIAADLGMGLKLTKNGTTSTGNSSGGDEEGEEAETNGTHIVRALYAFSGTNDDELQFDKGDLVTVTKIIDGGWWEGVCNDKVGWFPGNYVEEFSGDPNNPAADEEGGEHHYYNLVVKDILDSERTFVQDLHTLISVYLVPLKTACIVSSKDVDHLIGNLPEVNRWQQSFFKSLEDCSKFPVPQQNMGTLFLKASQEMETLYSVYCANHPKAVAVLTENSDKLSNFMESKGAASPGMLTLTSNLSKPFRRLEKYTALLLELQRHLTEGHADTENVTKSLEAYTAISGRTQEIRKKKDMEHEMLSNPVKGFHGSCLNDLGECACVIPANQAVNAEEVEEVFYLVFPSGSFIILAVGPSLSGYEIKSNFPLSSVSIKKGQHSEHWPWPVEVLHRQETIHTSLSSDKDQQTLIACVGRLEGVATPTTPSKSSHRISSSSGALTKADSAMLFHTNYSQRAMRRTSVPIQRAHHWGFKSLRPIPPLSTQQLIALREKDKSPRSTKKFIYPVVSKGKNKKRSSKHVDELLSAASNVKFPVDNRPGDNALLKVIESYCAGGRRIATYTDHPITYLNPSTRANSHSHSRSTKQPPSSSYRPQHHSAFMEGMIDVHKQDQTKSKSSTLPGSRTKPPSSPTHLSGQKLGLPGFPYRPPSPILLSEYHSETTQGSGWGVSGVSGAGKSASSKRSLFRRRAESVDTYKQHKVKHT